ncbi:MAG: hypothetical protein ABFD44_05325 [Anaerolineaceae bacterium]
MNHLGWGLINSLLLSTAFLLQPLWTAAAVTVVDEPVGNMQFSDVMLAADAERRQALVLWQRKEPDGSASLRARVYSASERPLTDIYLVATIDSTMEIETPVAAYDSQRDRYLVIYALSPKVEPRQWALYGRWISVEAGVMQISSPTLLAQNAAGGVNQPKLIFDPASGTFMLAYRKYAAAEASVWVVRLNGDTFEPVSGPVVVETNDTPRPINWYILPEGKFLLGIFKWTKNQVTVGEIAADLTVGEQKSVAMNVLDAALTGAGKTPLLAWVVGNYDLRAVWLDAQGSAGTPFLLRAHPVGGRVILPAAGFDPAKGALVFWVEAVSDLHQPWFAILPVPQTDTRQIQPLEQTLNPGVDQPISVACFSNGGCLVGTIDSTYGSAHVDLHRLGGIPVWLPLIEK